MRIVVTTFLSLDGVMESPDVWSGQFWADEAAAFKVNELYTADALLLGRVTYKEFAKAWPYMTDDTGFALRMNNIPKYVVSSTLHTLEWNNSTLLSWNIVQEVTKLKGQPGGDVLVEGSAELVNFLMLHNLVDEYRLMVHPVVVGAGKRLFNGGHSTTKLTLVETRAFASGVVVLFYHPTN